MKKLSVIGLMMILAAIFPAAGVAAQNEVLILFDDSSTAAPLYAKEKTLANLMGHFDLPYSLRKTADYTSGEMENYRATFYIGNTLGGNLPPALLDDVARSQLPFTWINFNLDQLAWSKKYERRFEKRFGLRYHGMPETNPYDQVRFDGRNFVRRQETISQVTSLNNDKVDVRAVAGITGNNINTMPYIVNSGNFHFVADNPLEIWYVDESYIAFTELLHEQLGIDHPENHRALVRIEDVDVEDDPEALKAIADYLFSENVPFSVGVIARFKDPLGATGPPRTIDLNEETDTIEALNYMVSKGGTLVMHGFTHQYDAVINPWTGMSGDDSEFYISGGPLPVGPVPEDSVEWVQGRIDTGSAIFNAAGFTKPTIWEIPHYAASELDQGVFASNFSAVYQRFPDAYFPYVINNTIYGNKLIPENLGYVNLPSVTPQIIIDRADLNLAVRDGLASFFFHPGVDINYLKTTINGIKALGYSFADVNSL